VERDGVPIGRVAIWLCILGGVIVVASIGIYAMTPSRHILVVRDDAVRGLSNVTVSLNDDVRAHGELASGESWKVTFLGGENGPYRLSMQPRSGFMQRFVLGYVRHGVTAVDTIAINDSMAVFRRGRTIGWR
jgi:hypothetical protein